MASKTTSSSVGIQGHNMVGVIGIEPTKTEANRVTACPNSPTLANTHINMVLREGIEPSSHDYQSWVLPLYYPSIERV
jgi:hypothetical protein